MKKDDLGNRMKSFYENKSRLYLTRRIPVILRLDGKAFHTFTKNCDKPFDHDLQDIMSDTARYLVRNIQGAKIAYIQSDEISILLTDFDKLTTDAWFGYNVQKMCSVAAAMCSVEFNMNLIKFLDDCYNPKFDVNYNQVFDCRCFNIPKEEVVNYFYWRYKDWLRNSLSMYCRSFFSHKELHGKNTKDMHEMLHKIGKNWATDLTDRNKNGTFLFVDDFVEYYVSPKDLQITFNDILYNMEE